MHYTKTTVRQKFSDLLAAFSDKLDAKNSWMLTSGAVDSRGPRFTIALHFQNGRHFEIDVHGANTAEYILRCVYETLDCTR